jgi:hypothetical protein
MALQGMNVMAQAVAAAKTKPAAHEPVQQPDVVMEVFESFRAVAKPGKSSLPSASSTSKCPSCPTGPKWRPAFLTWW